MGWKEALGLQKKPKISNVSSVWIITPLGKTKSEASNIPELPLQVLAHLGEAGPSSIQNVAEETGMAEDRARSIMRQMELRGYVRESGGMTE